MKYRKFTADLVFNGETFLDGSQVVITDEAGKIQAIISSEEAGDDIEYSPGLLMPGFVNCHCHLELSHMKGLIPPYTGLLPFLATVMTTRKNEVGLIEAEALRADREMYNNGIVAVGDICNSDVTLRTKKDHTKLFYHNFIEATGFLNENSLQRFQAANFVFDRFAQQGNVGHRQSIVPHAPYSVSEELFKRISDVSRGTILTMHNQESRDENDLFFSASGAFPSFYKSIGIPLSSFQPTGKSSLQSVMQYFSNSSVNIFVHNIATTPDDWSALDPATTFWCLCPGANRYIQNELPPLGMIGDDSLNIVIGTDSLASNSTLSILEEIKLLHKEFPQIPLSKFLSAATLNGARALQIDAFAGKLEIEKSPGLIVVSKMTRTTVSEDAEVLRLI